MIMLTRSAAAIGALTFLSEGSRTSVLTRADFGARRQFSLPNGKEILTC